jgi:hypothetical protein
MSTTQVCIVGGTGWGKTTFLGLLYIALTSYAVWNKEKFKFSPDLETTAYLNDDVIVPMLSGQFPEKTMPGSRQEVKLSLKFKRKLGWKVLEVHSYDIAGEDIKRTIEELSRGIQSKSPMIDEAEHNKTILAMVQSDILIFVVDSLIFNPEPSPENSKRRIETDNFLQQIWLAINEYRKRYATGKIRAIGIIFAKYDRVNPVSSLGEIKYFALSNADQPPIVEKDERFMLHSFENVFRKYFPFTYAAMLSSYSRLKPGEFNYFRSGLVMSLNIEHIGQRRPIALPLTFSGEELVRLALWLSKIN